MESGVALRNLNSRTEHSSVNRRVGSSNLARGAIPLDHTTSCRVPCLLELGQLSQPVDTDLTKSRVD